MATSELMTYDRFVIKNQWIALNQLRQRRRPVASVGYWRLHSIMHTSRRFVQCRR